VFLVDDYDGPLTSDDAPLTEKEKEIARLEQQAGYAALRGDLLKAKKLRLDASLKRFDLLQARVRKLDNGKAGSGP